MYTYLIRRIIYAINKFNKSVISRVTLPKTKLFVKKKVIIVQVIIYSDVHYPRLKFSRNTKVRKLADSLLVVLFCQIWKSVLPLQFSYFQGKYQEIEKRILKIFSGGFFMSSYTDLIIFTCKPSWSGASLLLRDLNPSSNSSSLNTVSFNVVFLLEDTI